MCEPRSGYGVGEKADGAHVLDGAAVAGRKPHGQHDVLGGLDGGPVEAAVRGLDYLRGARAIRVGRVPGVGVREGDSDGDRAEGLVEHFGILTEKFLAALRAYIYQLKNHILLRSGEAETHTREQLLFSRAGTRVRTETGD